MAKIRVNRQACEASGTLTPVFGKATLKSTLKGGIMGVMDTKHQIMAASIRGGPLASMFSIYDSMSVDPGIGIICHVVIQGWLPTYEPPDLLQRRAP